MLHGENEKRSPSIYPVYQRRFITLVEIYSFAASRMAGAGGFAVAHSFSPHAFWILNELTTNAEIVLLTRNIHNTLTMEKMSSCQSSNIQIMQCVKSSTQMKRFSDSVSITRSSRKRKLIDSCNEPCHQTSQSSAPLAMNPSMYLSAALRNKGIPPRVSHLSLDQALYFEPYREAQIPAPILTALRSNDWQVLEGMEVELLRRQRNSFGESLMHLVCRLGLTSTQYLIEEAKISLNVRDKFGRSPLHNACLAAIPNFKTVRLLLKHAPKLVIFEDNKGRTPFDYISARNRCKWSRFLSEDGILTLLQAALLKELRNQQKSKEGVGKDNMLRLSGAKSGLKDACNIIQKLQKESLQNPKVIDDDGEPKECVVKLFSRKPINFAPCSTSKASLQVPRCKVKL